MLATLFLIGSLIGALLTFNALRTRSAWLPALLIGEFALHHIAWQAAVTALFVWGGVLESVIGRIALGITLLSWMGLLVAAFWATRAKPVVAQALAGIGVVPDGDVPHSVLDVVRIRARLPAGVREEVDVPYGPDPAHRLDLHYPEDRSIAHPMLIQIHGGGWRRGNKEREGRPLTYHLAGQGWICAAINYRLSPEATFPDHLEDVKRAIAFMRANADRWGADPSFIALTGGSAGGHLAALAALTAGDLRYQPGFEDQDTHVQACVPFYGIHDLLDRNRVRYPWPFIEEIVMKVSPRTDPDAWDRASPLAQVHRDGPPFFLLHGSHDYLVPPGESRLFFSELQAASRAPVVYAEIPGATHGFDVFHSIRSRHVVHGVHSFLDSVHTASMDSEPRSASEMN